MPQSACHRSMSVSQDKEGLLERERRRTRPETGSHREQGAGPVGEARTVRVSGADNAAARSLPLNVSARQVAGPHEKSQSPPRLTKRSPRRRSRHVTATEQRLANHSQRARRARPRDPQDLGAAGDGGYASAATSESARESRRRRASGREAQVLRPRSKPSRSDAHAAARSYEPPKIRKSREIAAPRSASNPSGTHSSSPPPDDYRTLLAAGVDPLNTSRTQATRGLARRGQRRSTTSGPHRRGRTSRREEP